MSTHGKDGDFSSSRGAAAVLPEKHRCAAGSGGCAGRRTWDGVLAKRGHCGNVQLPCCTWCFPRLVCMGELVPGSVAVLFGGSTAFLCSSHEVADFGSGCGSFFVSFPH